MKTNKNDLVSVIIPAYKSEKYIENCLDSVINQTYSNIEIIVVNDCSPDNLEEIVLKYQKKDSRIIYLKNEVNMGVGPTRNKGIDKASGKYLYFLDSDDHILPNCIEELYNVVNEEDSFSCTIIGYKNTDGVVTTFSKTKEELMLLEYPSVCLRLFNKDIIDRANIRFSNLRIGEDWEFVFKLLMYNNKVTFIEKPLFTYVIHNDSSIRTYNKTQIDVLEVLDNIIEYSKKINCYDKFYEVIEYSAVSHILVGAIKRIKSFVNYDEEDISKCIDKINKEFPNWRQNKFVIKYLKDKDELQNL
jgi:glycosyltransferase involved in cell wall biosynthesis